MARVQGTATELPDDVDALKALLAERDARIAQLEHEVRVLTKLAFHPKSERRPAAPLDPNTLQGFLLFPELVEAAERVADRTGQSGSVQVTSTGDGKGKRKRSRRRSQFPPDAPRIRTTFELPADERTCACGGELHEIGEEVSRELERFELTIVHEIARKKYGCRSCREGVRTAQGPERVIDKGLLGPGFLAHVIIERFGNHMPYNRLERKYATEGLDLSRSVLCRSMQRCGELLEPIVAELRRQVLAGDVIRTDDTPVIVQSSSEGRRRKARLWVYLGLEGQRVYDYTESRSRDGPAEVLGDFRGYIQADAYKGYDAFFGPEKATEVGCMAHARRKFVDAEATDPELSKEAVDRIRELYAVERAAKDQGLRPDERGELRRRESVPRLEALGDWLETTRRKVLDKSPMARAIDYMLRQWDALRRYCEDGRLEIDNNDTERALRQVAVGRKNWLFVGNENGGRAAAVLYSLVETARAAGVDLRTYLRDVLLRIAHESDVRKLTPAGWKEHFAAEVQQHRLSILERLVAPSGEDPG